MARGERQRQAPVLLPQLAVPGVRAIPPDTRSLFIGDVQGCRAELESLLAKLEYDPERDRLFPVGDLVNRGPDSLGTLRLLRELDAEPVLGNHDLHLLRVARGTRTLGPGDTLDEVLAAPDADELLAWLAEQPFVRAVGDALVVHAGLHRDWADPLARLAARDPYTPDAEVDFATRVRTCRADGEPADAETPESERRPWYELRPTRPGETVVFGHWAEQGLLVRPGLRGLDSGCVWGGALSAWIAEEDRIVDVPARRVWCRPG